MKFRARESTDFIYVILRDINCMTVSELKRQARRAGKLDVDYHYVVQDCGVVEEGREQCVVAGYDLENSENSIYILVDDGGSGKLSDAQKVALADLIESIEATYPDIKVVK